MSASFLPEMFALLLILQRLSAFLLRVKRDWLIWDSSSVMVTSKLQSPFLCRGMQGRVAPLS